MSKKLTHESLLPQGVKHRPNIQSQKTQGFCVADSATLYDK